MSNPTVLFSSQLLIPTLYDYSPSSEKVLRFFNCLVEEGLLVSQIEVRLRLPTDEVMYATNAKTGEQIPIGKRMVDIGVSTLHEAIERIDNSARYILSLHSFVPVSALPLDLRHEDGSRIDPSRICKLHVSCIQSERRIQLSEPWHEHLRTFLVPEEKSNQACLRCGAIHTLEDEVQPRFYIEFSCREAFFPSFKESRESMRADTLAKIQEAFGTELFFGRFFH
jgi:hypothetical protein